MLAEGKHRYAYDRLIFKQNHVILNKDFLKLLLSLIPNKKFALKRYWIYEILIRWKDKNP